MKKLILLAIALSLCPTNIFSQDTIDTTITNTAVDTLFNTIYYKDGSFSTHDSFQTVCSIPFGVDKEEKYLLVECHIYTNGDEENIINAELIDRGVRFLRRNKNFDSAVSTSIYNMWSPLRARRLMKDGSLKPFVPFETFGNPKTLNCDRDSQGDVYFADMSVSVVRPKCLEKMNKGLLPQKWMGNKIAPIKSEGGFDLDYAWQIPTAEYWIKHNLKKIKK